MVRSGPGNSGDGSTTARKFTIFRREFAVSSQGTHDRGRRQHFRRPLTDASINRLSWSGRSELAARGRMLTEPTEPRLPERRRRVVGGQSRRLDTQGDGPHACLTHQRRSHRITRSRRSSSATPPASSPRQRRPTASSCSTARAHSSVSGRVDQGAGQTSYTADVDLAYDTDYTWRARAEFQGEPGPVVGPGRLQDAGAAGGRRRLHRRRRSAALDLLR